MKIIIAEKINKEIQQWQKKQNEPVKIVSWTSDLNYKVSLNETNLYYFTRSKELGIKIINLPWTQSHVWNYRSIPGDHDFEFKDFNQNIVVNAYLAEKQHNISRVNTKDKNGKNIDVIHFQNEQIAQIVDYDDNQHPVMSQFIGKHKRIEMYWQKQKDKLINTGMSLYDNGEERFYNNYWEWYFEEFKKIIADCEFVSEIISYEAPTLNISIPNRQVIKGQLTDECVTRELNKSKTPQKWIVQFEDKNYWKPRTDVTMTAKEMGYNIVNFDTPYRDEKDWMERQLSKYFKNVGPRDLVVWQYPKYSPTLELVMLHWFHDRKVVVAAFIHDVTLVREKIMPRKHYIPENDRQLLSEFDANIIPINFLGPLKEIASVTLKNVVPLSPYDFRINANVKPANYSQNVFYAGSLSKFPNLKNVDFELTVFGEKNYSNVRIVNNSIHDGGFVPAEKLAHLLNNGYGLIWDEDTDNKYYQRYTKWNWPYKFSLYMASGLPVIAWEKSAIAEVIKLGNLGLIVNSLSDIADLIADITSEEFDIMAQNAAIFGNKLAQGESTKTALKSLESSQFV
ncbi:glycosyl transferase [Leuconostoc sp. MS02]|uniref:Glycosyl transferase n=1 Tax=Leuconostoc aquikimchii TaxID=3236804 RepID=A0ABV3S370_9LACO